MMKALSRSLNKSMAVGTLLLVGNVTAAHAGLVSFWNFNESSGTTAFDSVGSVNGTLDGTAAFVGGGVQGGAVSISGVGSLVDMGDHFNFTNADAYTLQVWVKMSVGDSSGYIVASRHFGGQVAGYFLGIGNTGDGCGGAGGGVHLYSEFPCSGGSTLLVNDGAWHQIVGTFQGGVASIYIDGQFQAASSGTTLNPIAATDFLVGGLTVAGTPFNDYTGLVDNVGIWNNALNATQVRTLFDEGGDPNPTPSSAPEPGSLALAFTGASLLFAYRSRKAVKI